MALLLALHISCFSLTESDLMVRHVPNLRTSIWNGFM